MCLNHNFLIFIFYLNRDPQSCTTYLTQSIFDTLLDEKQYSLYDDMPRWQDQLRITWFTRQYDKKKGIVLSRGVHWAVILLYHENIQFIYLINMSFTISKKSFYVEEF